MIHNIACPVCGKNQSKVLFDKQGCTFVQCLNDKLVYVNPQPSPKELQKVYDRYGRDIFVLPESIANSGDYVHYRKKFLNFRETNRLLEIGAAAGGFLIHCRNDGWKTYGVELSIPSSTFAREHHQLDVMSGTIHDARYPTECFDVVVAWQTLEHVPNPREVITEVFRILRTGGFFVMSVPCWKGLSIRLLKKKYRYVGRDHLFYFSPHNLQRMLSDIGFTQIICKTGGFNPIVFYKDTLSLIKKNAERNLREGQRIDALTAQLRKDQRFKGIHRIYYRLVEILNLGDTLFSEAIKTEFMTRDEDECVFCTNDQKMKKI